MESTKIQPLDQFIEDVGKSERRVTRISSSVKMIENGYLASIDVGYEPFDYYTVREKYFAELADAAEYIRETMLELDEHQLALELK